MQDSFYANVADAYNATHIIAYGSGPFKQIGNIATQYDFIFVVENPIEWHLENMKIHRSDYSFIGRGALELFPLLQDWGPGIWYHSNVEFEDRLIKYGVISLDKLVNDLHWKTFYVSGRMQKPHLVLKEDPRVVEANHQNLKNAIGYSLFMLPREFQITDLWMEIAAISYTGDTRMAFAEDKNKIAKIVCGREKLFADHYREAASEFRLDVDEPVLENPFYNLNDYLLELPIPGAAQMILSAREDVQKYLRRWVEAKVRRASIVQTLKGVPSAGIYKSIFYSLEKIKKSRRSRSIDIRACPG